MFFGWIPLGSRFIFDLKRRSKQPDIDSNVSKTKSNVFVFFFFSTMNTNFGSLILKNAIVE